MHPEFCDFCFINLSLTWWQQSEVTWHEFLVFVLQRMQISALGSYLWIRWRQRKKPAGWVKGSIPTSPGAARYETCPGKLSLRPMHSVHPPPLSLSKKAEHWRTDAFELWLLGKTLESPLGCKEIKLVNPKENQPLIFTGGTDTEGEAPILGQWMWRAD